MLDFLHRIGKVILWGVCFDSEGLVFLTNDGDVASVCITISGGALFGRVQGLPNLRTARRLQSGVRLADGDSPAKVRLLKSCQ